MTELEKAIAKLQQSHDDLKKRVDELTAREQSRRISRGQDAPHHIGQKTKEVLRQEIFSILNVKRERRAHGADQQVLHLMDELDALGEDSLTVLAEVTNYLSQKEREIYLQLMERRKA